MRFERKILRELRERIETPEIVVVTREFRDLSGLIPAQDV